MNAAFALIGGTADLTSIARAVGERSADRYRELAESFDMACNRDTALAFRTLAEDEDRRAAALPPAAAPPPARSLDWFEQAPEIADPDSVHYLMLPWHAYDLALRAEGRIQSFFAELAATALDADIAAQARHLAERVGGHVAAIRARRDASPHPHPGWWEDEDGPNWDAD